MNKKITYFLVRGLILLLMVVPITTQAQLIVNTGLDADELAQELVGSGVEVSNAVLTCDGQGSGTFDGTFTTLGLDNGVILTSGDANLAIGPNNSTGDSGAPQTPGDADLDLVSAFGTNDACILEFDVVPFGDTLKFNYVFGSEEYLEFVDQFNDVFGFFISGPGFDGPFSLNAENIALIPGTNEPVTINSVNDQDNSEFFVCNGDPTNSCGPFFPVDVNSTLEYDGLTTVLQAIAAVTPCETYHLKLAVADALDNALDSGVFIEGQSLSVSTVTLSATTTITSIEGLDYAVEGCVDGIFTFTRDDNFDQDLVIEYEIVGSAVNGEDYEEIPNSITIPAGESSVDLLIQTFEDGIEEGAEEVILNIVTDFGCDGQQEQQASLNIQDAMPLTVSDDVTISSGEAVQLEAVGGGFNYFWTPTENITGANQPDPTVFPTETTVYTVTTVLGDCVYQESVTVSVNACFADASWTSADFCEGDADFDFDGDASDGVWSGPGISEDGDFDPSDAGPGEHEITHTVFANEGDEECEDAVTQIVTVFPEINASFDEIDFCIGQEAAAFDADEPGGTWSGTGINEDGVFDPAVSGPGSFEITYSFEGECPTSSTETVEVTETFDASFDDVTLCPNGDEFELEPVTSGGDWDGEGVNSNGVFDPSDVDDGASYVITYTVGEGACASTYEGTVTVTESISASFEDIELCEGDAGGAMDDLADPNTDGGTWFIEGEEVTNLVPADYGPGEYDIDHVVTDGDCSFERSGTLEVTENTDASFESTSICEDDSDIDLDDLFDPEENGGDWTIDGIELDELDPSDFAPGTYEVTHDVGDASCGGSAEGTITILDSGDAFFPAPDLCFEGPEFQLEATEPGGIWEGEGVDENGMFDPAGLDPGFYEVTHFVGEEGCLDAHTGVVVIYEQISIEIVDGPDCIDYTGEYEVTFEISGGGIGPYSVEGDITVTAVDGNQVSFMGTGAGQVLDFTVTDMTSACEGSITWIAPDCPTCNPDAGEMAAETIYACVSDSVETHALGAIIDPDAILIYAVHSNSTFNEDEIITFNESGIFYQSDIGAAMNTTYYVSGVVGTDLGGFVDYNDGCTDITPSSTPIVYLMPITMSATTDCAIGTGVFSTTFTVSGGLPAFDGSSYTGGGDLEGVSLGNGDSYTVEGYFDQGTYSATATDGWSCAGSITEGPNDCLLCSASVEMPQSETIICQDGEAGGAAFNVELDGYDLFYVVHDDPVNLPGNIVGVKPASSNGIFYFSDLFGTASYATDYYVSAVIAPDAGDGTPDLTHPCLTIAVGPKVVWLGPVTFDTEILCDEDAGIYEVMVNIAGGYPEYVPGEDYLINLGGLNQIQLFAEDLPYNIGPFVAGSIFEIYATDDWDCDQTGFVSDAIDCKAGEECPETQSLAEAICSEDGLTYDLVVSVTGGTEGFTLEDLSTGAVVSTDLPSEGAYVVEGIPAGTEYSYVLFDNSNLDCATVLTGAPSCTPPVSIELIRFAGEAQSDGNYLYWYTATEFESDYFELQGSKDGISWEVIAQVEAAGFSNTQMNYDFLDASAEGLTYYRLNEVDQAGKETLSNVIALNRSSDSFMVGSIAPVPTSGISQVNIESVNNNIITVSLFDLAGRMMMNREVELTEGANQFDVDLSSFSSGIYMLNIQDGITEMNYKLIRD